MADLIIEHDKQIDGTTVTLDGIDFSRSTISNCSVRYSGGEYAIDGVTWNRNRFILDGPAARTAFLFARLGWLKDDAPVFFADKARLLPRS